MYELIDAGHGRKLERFGSRCISRPAPAAQEPPLDPAAWAAADGTYYPGAGEGAPGRWEFEGAAPEGWTVTIGGIVYELRPTPTGQVGVFPEATDLRADLAERIREESARRPEHAPPRILDLFCYTGGLGLTAARAGAAVTAIDASKPAIAWLRRNVDHNDLSDRPLRSIAEDVPKFVARERRRGGNWDGVALDPPTFGRGPRGERWEIERGLAPLLRDVAAILSQDARFVLVTAHAEGWSPARLAREVERALG
ncbi:MAG: RsmD family RNA methyltransferase, partial [Gemmatimonadetes bacterium]|nr:RsmD family RNA methyltransferase [Gemmatimonadota bacterium]